MMGKNKVWINGRVVDTKNAKVSVFDRGFLYGDGVFETMRAYAGSVFKLDEHLERLFRALKVVRIKPPYGRKYFKALIQKLLKMNSLENAYVRLAVTRGKGGFGIGYKNILSPSAVLIARQFKRYPAWMHERGINAGIVDIRQNDLSPLCGIKSMNYLKFVLARFRAKEAGCDEAILMNTKGFITEAATSNIFLVKGGGLVTPSPDSGILPGITRGVILRIAKKLRMKAAERRVAPRELSNADEIFLTNSLAGVLPVTRIGGKKVGNGKPGELTKLLAISYRSLIKRPCIPLPECTAVHSGSGVS
jgi:branched-chain amino acid aminotransferase